MVRAYSTRLEGALPVSTLTEVLAGLIIWILGLLTLLQQVFEVDIRAILAALGVGGLAVALALQDTLSNLFAGFYVSVARQIRIGDFVKIDAGQNGYVQDIGWRSTTLRDLSGNLIFIPNNKLAQSIVTNYNLPQRPVGLGITVPVTYDADPSQVERLLTEVGFAAIGQVPGLLKEPAPSAKFIPGFGKTIHGFYFGLPCGRVRGSVPGPARTSQTNFSPVSAKKVFTFDHRRHPGMMKARTFVLDTRIKSEHNGRREACPLYVLPSTIEGR